jgi:hypothetical protein
MFNNLVFPISKEKADSNMSRLTVFINALLKVSFIFTLNPLFLYVVTIDCGIRALGYNKYSPLCFLASLVVKLLGIKPKMVDKAPKMFASRLGFICAALGTIFITFGIPMASIGVIAFFTLLAVLDSVFNFCVGCLLYHSFVFPFYNKA